MTNFANTFETTFFIVKMYFGVQIQNNKIGIVHMQLRILEQQCGE